MQLDGILSELSPMAVNCDARVIAGRPIFDSRKVEKGDVFFALNGATDGNAYAFEAVQRGAVAVIGEATYKDLPCVTVENARQAFAIYSTAYYGHPEMRVKIIGVTGTNGKTSVTKILSHILQKNNFKTALIGTLGAIIDGKEIETGMTTPDANEFFRLLKLAADVDTDYMIMEISAHAIYYDKLYGAPIEYCVFTNLSRDHLDFFGTMESYGSVKRSLFMGNKVLTAVINSDDDCGRRILAERDGRTVTYGLNNPSDVFALEETYDNGLRCVVNAFDEIAWIAAPLTGRFNLYNVLAAVTVATDIGLDLDDIKDALCTLPPIDGRFNAIYGEKYTVIIDYAHTPDGLEKVLTTARAITANNLICVFGCGGNRDAEKRPIMGEIAQRLADLCIITSDNPRYESPQNIIDKIVEGARKVSNANIAIVDRERAIRFALKIAGKGDVVLIAGKGAENYIEIRGTKYPFSDKEVCFKAMRGE